MVVDIYMNKETLKKDQIRLVEAESEEAAIVKLKDRVEENDPYVFTRTVRNVTAYAVIT